MRRLLVSAISIGILILCLPIRALADGLDGMYAVRERFGVDIAAAYGGIEDFPGSLTDFANVDQVGFGWYSDWGMHAQPETLGGTIEYAQMLPTQNWPPSWPQVQRITLANPGAIWMIGNEPETRGQGQLTPEEYAVIYAEAYAFIKSVDSNAQIAIGGVVMPTPLRLEWLDRCLAFYQTTYSQTMPVDVWNIHLQILQEKRGDWGCGIPYGLDDDEGRLYEIIDNCSADQFQQLIYEFCEWLVEHGERDKPLIISEYGVLMPSDYLPNGDQSVVDFMVRTFDFMMGARDPELGFARDDDRLVQRWLWFSLNFPFHERTPGGFNGALYDWEKPDELTVFGKCYQNTVLKWEQVRRVYLPVLLAR